MHLRVHSPSANGNLSHSPEGSIKNPCVDIFKSYQQMPSGLSKSQQLPQDRRAVNFLFPSKLRRILDDAEVENNQHIISWLPDGKSFKVHDPEAFTSKILGRYLCQKRFSSFTRQLYHYGFGKIDTGKYKGSFFHPKFRRDDVHSCIMMDRKSSRADVGTVHNMACRITGCLRRENFDAKKIEPVHEMHQKYSQGSSTVRQHHSSTPFTCHGRIVDTCNNNHQFQVSDKYGGLRGQVQVDELVVTESCYERMFLEEGMKSNDWLSTMESLTWPIQSSNDVAVDHSIGLLLEPRPLEEMLQVPDRLEDAFLGWDSS